MHTCVTEDGMGIACVCEIGEDHDESEMEET